MPFVSVIRTSQPWASAAYAYTEPRLNSYRFLEACRRVRNAFTHVSFDEYDGPAAAQPQPVVVRLE
jgi:hypothetical protein